jgi:hypothetical protein
MPSELSVSRIAIWIWTDGLVAGSRSGSLLEDRDVRGQAAAVGLERPGESVTRRRNRSEGARPLRRPVSRSTYVVRRLRRLRWAISGTVSARSH